MSMGSGNTGCPTRYRTRHLFNNFTTNEDVATKFEADLPHCVRNVKERNVLLLKFRCNIFTGVQIIKEMPGSVASGTPCSITAIAMVKLLICPHPCLGLSFWRNGMFFGTCCGITRYNFLSKRLDAAQPYKYLDYYIMKCLIDLLTHFRPSNLLACRHFQLH